LAGGILTLKNILTNEEWQEYEDGRSEIILMKYARRKLHSLRELLGLMYTRIVFGDH
jgi:hypothetical protein